MRGGQGISHGGEAGGRPEGGGERAPEAVVVRPPGCMQGNKDKRGKRGMTGADRATREKSEGDQGESRTGAG